MPLRALARVNLAAIERNVARLRGGAGRRRRAVRGRQGRRLRPRRRCRRRAPRSRAGRGGSRSRRPARRRSCAPAGSQAPLLVMGALSAEELAVALAARRRPRRLERAVRRRGRAARGTRGRPVRVHVKLDTGMGRLGTRDPDEAIARRRGVAAAAPALELAGAMTHFATADEDPGFTAAQLGAFPPFVAAMRERRPGIAVHAANSAATLREPASHFDLSAAGSRSTVATRSTRIPRRTGSSRRSS